MKEGSHRPVLLVGSVPLKPASEVFRVATHYLGEVMARFPDGEQVGWLPGVWQRMAENPALEPTRKVALVGARDSTDFFSQLAIQYYGVKPGSVKQGLTLGPYGIAENAIASYRQFKQMKKRVRSFLGGRASRLRCPAHWTVHSSLNCQRASSFPSPKKPRPARSARSPRRSRPTISPSRSIWPLRSSLRNIGGVQKISICRFTRGSIGRWRTKPRSLPMSAIAFPPNIELGFHLCSIWHIDQSKGQDNNVHVDWCNALSRKIDRPIGYIHMPTIPEHQAADFAPLRRLKLHPETQLFLGVIHMDDGLEGARRRIAAAASAITDFGVGAFCGLAQPSRQEAAHPHTVEEIFALHRKVAEL